jgi:hypothetical protein
MWLLKYFKNDFKKEFIFLFSTLFLLITLSCSSTQNASVKFYKSNLEASYYKDKFNRRKTASCPAWQRVPMKSSANVSWLCGFYILNGYNLKFKSNPDDFASWDYHSKKLEKSIYIKKHLCKLLKTKITAV